MLFVNVIILQYINVIISLLHNFSHFYFSRSCMMHKQGTLHRTKVYKYMKKKFIFFIYMLHITVIRHSRIKDN
jgi:hypothetical protein